MKVVINKCFGGFGLSFPALKRLYSLKGNDLYAYIQSKYEWKDGENEYTRICEEEYDKNEHVFIYYTNKDLGNKVSEIEDFVNSRDLERTDKDLIKVVKEFGESANTMCSKLKVIEIPDGVEYTVEEYDGQEWIAEKHRTWG